MKCFHHNDLDGRAAGAVVAQYENNYNPSDYFEVDYSTRIPIEKIDKDERVYFVDYSFTEDTIDTLESILDITKNVIWIDHHKSSIKLVGMYPDLLERTKGIIRDDISGAALTYMYIYGVSYDDIPLALKYVSDYDCHILSMPDVMEFKYGIDIEDYSPLSDIWGTLLSSDGYSTINYIITNGRIAKRYHDNQCESIRNSIGYESLLDGYKVLVINRDGNSTLFGDKFNEYDICVRWSFNGRLYTYSLYTTRDDIDVSEIAENRC